MKIITSRTVYTEYNLDVEKFISFILKDIEINENAINYIIDNINVFLVEFGIDGEIPDTTIDDIIEECENYFYERYL